MQIDIAETLEKISRLRDALLSAQGEARSFNAKAGLLRACDALDYQKLIFSEPAILMIASRPGAERDELLQRLQAAEQELASAIGCLIEFKGSQFFHQLEVQLRILDSVITHARGALRGALPKKQDAGAETKSPSVAPAAADLTVGAQSPARLDAVHLGASAPASVVASQFFAARFVAYLDKDEAKVRDRLRQLTPERKVYLGGEAARIPIGSKLQVLLQGADVVVEDEEQAFLWTGEPVFLSYAVKVLDRVVGGSTLLKFSVLLEGIVVAKVVLELAVGVDIAGTTEAMGQRFAKTAFASYSSKDRARVLDRVASIRIAAGMDVFLDCMDLRPSEKWKPRLEQEIAQRELFMLFWSRHAKKSAWVTWESNRAYERKGLDRMQFHPLENGVKPPLRLRGIHVADPYVGLREASLPTKRKC